MQDYKKLDKQDIEDILALTPMQEGMLFHYINDRSTDMYFEQLSLLLKGEIDVDCLIRAWDIVVEKNEMLRCIYRWGNIENPLQLIIKKYKPNIKQYDFSRLPQNRQSSLLSELLENDRKEKIDISVEPYRILLCKLSNNEYQMIISNHHIIFDGWSSGIILKELFEAYEDLFNGKQLEAVNKVRFKNYIKWIKGNSKEAQEQFWKQYLQGFNRKTLLPFDNMDYDKYSGRQTHVYEVSTAVTEQLSHIAKKYRTTLASVIYTIWGIILQKYNGCNDVLFGATVSGRVPELKGIENTVGLFINTVPIRVNMQDDTTTVNLLESIDDALRNIYKYQTTPLVDIKRYLKIDGKKDLFNSIVVIQNYPIDETINNPERKINIVSYSVFEQTNFDLTIGVMLSEGITFNFIYNEKQFEKESIQGLAECFDTVIKEITENCEKRVSQIDILSDEQKDQLKLKFAYVDTSLTVKAVSTEYVEASNQLEQALLEIWCKVLQTERISVNDNFFDIGGNSVLLIKMHTMINKIYPNLISGTDLFSYPTISKLAKYIRQKNKTANGGEILSHQYITENADNNVTDTRETSHISQRQKDIAIIGMSVKMPMAENVTEFWENLKNGVDSIRHVPQSRLTDIKQALKSAGESMDAIKLGKAAFLEEIDKFDYKYFQISPKEASLMDPNQRLFLQTAWEAIEDAGYGGQALIGSRTGVFIGFNSDSEYKSIIRKINPDAVSMAVPGNVKPIIASRLSYLMDFRGPSINIDTTCSSSLTAVHLACKSIRQGECEQAVAGGIQLHLLPVRHAEIGVEASDGRAKTFDDKADGTGTGEGVGVVLLKPLEQALKDGDSIYAVIKGSAINHDGSSIGITAPSAVAQEDVIINAWKDAGVAPESISYIEAHGTGTKLGDPIEIDGITRAFSRYTNKKQFCGIGSVKTNIGHLDNASGIAGLIKSALSLRHGMLPPTLNFDSPNSRIDFEASPVYINNQLSKWEVQEAPRRCGISSFGLSGTNCHVILEEAPIREQSSSPQSLEFSILALSAKSQQLLFELIKKYRRFLRETENSLEDICYTANTGRGHYECRLAIIAASKEEMHHKLEIVELPSHDKLYGDGLYYGKHKVTSVRSQGKDSFEISDSQMNTLTSNANQEIDGFITNTGNCSEKLNNIAKLYIKGAQINWTMLYSKSRYNRVSTPTYPFERCRCWVEADYLQNIAPLLERCVAEAMDTIIYSTDFSVEKYWVLNEHKIGGNAVLVGTSYLEMVMEGCMQYFPQGLYFKDVQFITTLSVGEDEVYEVQLVLKKIKDSYEFYIASKNKSDNASSDISWVKHVEGKVHPMDDFNVRTIDTQVLKKQLNNAYIEPDIDNYNLSTVFEFGQRWKNIKYMHIGQIELISYLEIPKEFRAELPRYPLHPSMLDNALATIPILQHILNASPNGKDGNEIYLPFSYGTVKVHKPLPEQFYSYVRLKGDAEVSKEIVSFDITFCDIAGRSFIEIENYCLKRMRKQGANFNHNKDLYYKLDWIPRVDASKAAIDNIQSVIVFKDKKDLGEKTIQLLRDKGINTIEVELGSEYKKLTESKYIISSSQENYSALMGDIKKQNPSHILHMFTLDSQQEIHSTKGLEARLQQGIWSLFYLYKAVMQIGFKQTLEVLMLSNHVNSVIGCEADIIPENAAFAGLGKVLRKEYPGFNCRCIDIDDEFDADNVLNELTTEGKAYQTAYRSGDAYIEQLNTFDITQMEEREFSLKEDGVYIITGGTGGIGLEIGKLLAAKVRIKLALINRSELPEKSQWQEILEKNSQDKLTRKIRNIREIEQAGAEVICIKADVSSESDMAVVLDALRQKYGNINGVIHSAGIPGDGFVIIKEEQKFHDVLKPKVHGTWILSKLTQNDNLDFFVMCSSNNSLIGIQGQGDYTAANSYLDSFAYYMRTKGKKALTINWPAWKDTGMAFDYGVNVDGIMKTMSSQQAIYSFEQVMKRDVARVIIGEFNPTGNTYGISLVDAEINISQEIMNKLRKSSNIHEPQAKQAGRSMAQVVLTGKEDEQYTETEKEIAMIWGEVLGYEEIGINDSFFDIGGDSISITKVHSMIEQKYPGRVQMGELFAYPTILQTAQLIHSEEESLSHEIKQDLDTASEADIEKNILEMFEQLEQGTVSIDDVSEIMKKFNNAD